MIFLLKQNKKRQSSVACIFVMVYFRRQTFGVYYCMEHNFAVKTGLFIHQHWKQRNVKETYNNYNIVLKEMVCKNVIIVRQINLFRIGVSDWGQ